MTYALAIAGFPKDNLQGSEYGAWNNVFLPTVLPILQAATAVERLSASAWLFPLGSELHSFGLFLAHAKGAGVPVRVLMLDQKPNLLTMTAP